MSKKTDQKRVHSEPTKLTKVAAKKSKRPVSFSAEGWYASAASSIAITNTGRGDRVSGQWIAQLNHNAD
jgi:hypothetical protein